MGRWWQRELGALVILAGLGVPGAWGELPRLPGDRMTIEQIEKGAPAVHPATLYVLAQRLFEGGRRDEAVFWYYLGELRFRFYLESNPHLDPRGDPALFRSLSEEVGAQIQRYGGEDRKKLRATLTRVREWDRENPNGFTSKDSNHAVWLKVCSDFDLHADKVALVAP